MSGKPITIAVASGKGGTGKTTVAVNLAIAAGEGVCLLDCDVEEPNSHIFIRPEWEKKETVTVAFPQVDENLCTACGKCRKACRFNAIVVMGKKPLFFPELCHSCGACLLACPENAIAETRRKVGELETGRRGELLFAHGRMDIGEAKSPPLIGAVRQCADSYPYVIIDAPPGTACPVVASVRGVDYCVLVAEPTPFGMHDVEIAAELVKSLGVRHGMVINRSDIGDDRARRFCEENGVTILAEIPFDREAAEAYSRGELLVERFPRYEKLFRKLWLKILSEATV